MVISWPKRISDKGGLRSQFTHVIDVAPTILELVGVPLPKLVNGIEQVSMHGTSFAYTFNDATAAERHTQQYFEILGNRGMYKDGWIASCKLDRIPWALDLKDLGAVCARRLGPGEERRVGTLQHDGGFLSQANDLAGKSPEKLAELKALFWEEAEKYNVTPLLGALAVSLASCRRARARRQSSRSTRASKTSPPG